MPDGRTFVFTFAGNKILEMNVDTEAEISRQFRKQGPYNEVFVWRVRLVGYEGVPRPLV